MIHYYGHGNTSHTLLGQVSHPLLPLSRLPPTTPITNITVATAGTTTSTTITTTITTNTITTTTTTTATPQSDTSHATGIHRSLSKWFYRHADHHGQYHYCHLCLSYQLLIPSTRSTITIISITDTVTTTLTDTVTISTMSHHDNHLSLSPITYHATAKSITTSDSDEDDDA